MDKNEIPNFRAATRDVKTLIKLVERLKDDEMQPVVSAVKRQLLELPAIRGKDRPVTRSDVLRDLGELIDLVGEYHYGKLMNLNNLERMFFDEARALIREQRGADTFVLAAPTQHITDGDSLPEKIFIRSIAKGHDSIEADEASDYILYLCFDTENLEYYVVDSRARPHSKYSVKIERFNQVVHADNKIAFVPVPGKGYNAIVIEMPSSKEVEAFLKQLSEVAPWYHE